MILLQESYEVIRFGAATTLTHMIEKLKAHQEKSGFKYFLDVYKHLKMVANSMVRNVSEKFSIKCFNNFT